MSFMVMLFSFIFEEIKLLAPRGVLPLQYLLGLKNKFK